MKSKIEKLGKVSITVEKDYWDKNKTYNRLTIVERQGTRTAYLSRKVVPIGVEITDRNYWITISKWADIPYEIVQEFGDSPELVISQKVVTLKVNELQGLIDNINNIIGEGGSIDERIATAKSELIDGASEEGDTFKKLEDRLSDVEESVGEGGSVDERIAVETNRAQAAEELLREAYESLSQSQAIPKTAEEWAAMTSWEEGVIYRVAGTTSYTDYMYNGTTTIPMATYDNAIDDEPTAGSDNLVKSGGVYNSTPTVAHSSAESDLDISDEQGYVLMRLTNGHIQVKNFSSLDVLDSIQAILSNVGFDNIPEFSEEKGYDIGDIVSYEKYVYVFTSAHEAGAWDSTEVEKTVINTEHPVDVETYNSTSDLDISDEQNNVLARFTNGHFKTKYFDSSKEASEQEHGLMAAKDKIKLNTIDPINLSSIYSRENPFGLSPNIVYKDAVKRTLPLNLIPLVIIAGQSNADGRASYETALDWDNTRWLAESDYTVQNYFMWKDSVNDFLTYNVLTNNGAGSDNGSDGSGVNKYCFDPFFAKKFIETYNIPLYAVRESLGGIGIEDAVLRAGYNNTWNAKIGYIEQKYSISNVRYLLLLLLNKINKIQKWCQDNNKILFPVAILWHQGEHDASDTLRPYFKENTSEVISFIRGIFKTPALPFINGFVQNDYSANFAEVNQIFLELNEIDDYMKTVDMAGHYTSIGDGLHYDGQALAYMGEQMFNYYKQLNSLI